MVSHNFAKLCHTLVQASAGCVAVYNVPCSNAREASDPLQSIADVPYSIEPITSHGCCIWSVVARLQVESARNVPSPNQVPAPDVPSSTSSDVPQRSPSTAGSAILPFFGAQAWRRYFGEVGTEPPLPSDINQIMSGPCPFWSGKSVQDTHLLVLIPSRVSGEPLSFNLLEKLIKRPQDGGYPTAYSFYGSDVRAALGAQAPEGAYWVLMTRAVLEGSRNKRYDAQKKLISDHARRTRLSYELPGALEAATVMLSHYVRTGERLYSDSPLTYTRCRELIDNELPVVVGGFSSEGLFVDFSYDFIGYYDDGVSCLRKF
jgi:hypothetical protein